MRALVLRVGTLVLASAAAAMSGCGGTTSAPAGDRIAGSRLTIYVSVPLDGASRPEGKAVAEGAQVALDQVHGRVGHFTIALRTLDDSTLQAGSWDPGVTTLNARTAAADPTTIAYLGELDSGASAISIPILNRAGVLEISPTSSAVGLTSSAAGAAPGEPQKYYPTGTRTFARVVPNDAVQAAAQVRLQQGFGCSSTYVVDDGTFEGEDMADSFQLVARSAGLRVIGVQTFPDRAASYLTFAGNVAQSGADCVLISADAGSGTALMAEQLAAAMPQARFFGSAAMAQPAFVTHSAGGIPVSLDRRFLLTVPALGDAAGASARSFAAAFARRYGPPPPAAFLGYEAMSLALGAIGRATDHGSHVARRSKVLEDVFKTRKRDSVLGGYAIDSGGDPTIERYGVYRLAGGALRLWTVVRG